MSIALRSHRVDGRLEAMTRCRRAPGCLRVRHLVSSSRPTLRAVCATRTALDEPTDLPEGTEVELTAVFDDDLGPEER